MQTVADRNPSFRFLAEPRRFDDDEAHLIEQCFVEVGLEHFVCIFTFVHLPDHANGGRYQLAAKGKVSINVGVLNWIKQTA